MNFSSALFVRISASALVITSLMACAGPDRVEDAPEVERASTQAHANAAMSAGLETCSRDVISLGVDEPTATEARRSCEKKGASREVQAQLAALVATCLAFGGSADTQVSCPIDKLQLLHGTWRLDGTATVTCCHPVSDALVEP